MIKIRHCLHCGAEFRSRSGVQKYCSIQCTESAKYEKRKSREKLLSGIEAMADAQRQDYLTFSNINTTVYQCIINTRERFGNLLRAVKANINRKQ